MDETTRNRIQTLVDSDAVVLFMKGTRLFPRCGFSATAVHALKMCGVTSFADVDVLKDPDIRQGIKEFSNWPTIPQLYVKGKFIGGSDILREMVEAGELQKVLSDLATPSPTP
ncbi:MAG: Grx4 family monothiol glutaredoxin [Myxococcota bacterium]